ncbi:MAG: hypothetical protein KF821_02085 [Anaerolineales bacterium]|nr:hypothetical protein [Anaerolineales bacterium]
MSKKQLNTENVLSELTGQSAFFPKDAETPTPSDEVKPNTRPPERATERTIERPTEQTPERVIGTPARQHRIIRRYSFEAYDDQVRHLKKISLEAEIAGETRSISEMIREAVDSYLKTQNEVNPTQRSTERPNG